MPSIAEFSPAAPPHPALIAVSLARIDRGEPPTVPMIRGGLAPHRLRRVQSYVETHLTERLPLCRLAEIARLSPKHFSRVFTQTTGQSPHRWVILRRVAVARELLETTDLSLSDIALACGFADQSHFTALFRRHLGTPPGLWRQRYHAALADAAAPPIASIRENPECSRALGAAS